MKTYSDDVIELAKRVTSDATILAGRDHTVEEYKLLLTRLGSGVEVYLKLHVFLGQRNWSSFNDLIDVVCCVGSLHWR
jgi:hypothetical protein